jgi:hypothetical protein
VLSPAIPSVHEGWTAVGRHALCDERGQGVREGEMFWRERLTDKISSCPIGWMEKSMTFVGEVLAGVNATECNGYTA